MQPTQLKQPKGLYYLSASEMWERFGFYAVQALLVLYLTNLYQLSDAKAYGIFGTYTALIYLTPVLGGYLADRILGFRHSIIVGACLLTAGYFSLACLGKNYFYFSLALLILGNGFFKSCISSLLGALYAINDKRRDSGFTIFYMGINIGAFTSTVICPILAVKFGYPYGFAMASIGMLLGLMIFILSLKSMGKHGYPPRAKLLNKNVFLGLSVRQLIIVAALLMIYPISLLLGHNAIVNWGMLVLGVGLAIMLFVHAFNYAKPQRNKFLVLLILMMFATGFWTLYWQIYLSIMLFIERNVDRHIAGWTIPTAMASGFVLFYIVILAPFFVKGWLWLAQCRKNISYSEKFSLGLFFIGCGFLLFALGSYFSRHSGYMPFYWVGIAYLLFTMGELSLSPIGLSAVTALAPPKLVGLMMGVWFLTLAAGGALAAKVAKFSGIPPSIHNPLITAGIYREHFIDSGIAGIILAVLLMMLTPWLRRMLDQ